jgi:OmcA/MtrC family decaheme c-type cytochrome
MVNGQVYGYIADEPLLEHESGTGAELPAGTHVHLYDNVANTALAFGDASVTDPDAYVSAANVAGCVKCHGSPYLKHGFRAAEVAGLPDFASCKVCHNDAGQGGHTEWQYMVDEPFNWATGVVETADYSYNRNIMNDVHMAHAMEFPYPQSMATCNTCHEGKLAQVLDNSEFTPETCKSCHPIQGIDAWPEYVAADGTTIEEGPYFQPHRAPAFQYLWTLAGVEGLHTPTPMVCNGCHSPGAAPTFNELHSGYDKTIYDASGVRYADAYTVSIDQITRSGDLLTVNFSSSDPAIVPELLVSFYGWDTKHFIVGSHERDGNPVCTGFRPGCKMEYVPESSGGGANPLFMEDAASVPGNWMVTLDMSALQLTKTALIPQLIADGDIKMAEITITPELNLGGTDVVLEPVDETFDLGSSMIVANYFKGTEATVDIDKCNVCHDALASSFHDGSGRGGDGIEVCKNCHTTTFPGSHLEMASRSIENYVHAIHTFQDFDVGGNNGTFGAAFDPVDAKRYDQHIKHVFPNFTIRNCEACHVEADARVFPPPDLDTTTYPVTYNVPDQSKSMPGVLSASDAVATWYELVGGLAVEDPAGRNIGTVPEVVTGPASRACGGCHRGRLIRDDAAGDLASLNAHTEAGGTFVENDDADAKLFGIIEKIMGMFE